MFFLYFTLHVRLYYLLVNQVVIIINENNDDDDDDEHHTVLDRDRVSQKVTVIVIIIV